MRTLERLSGTAPWHRLSPRPLPDDGADDPVHHCLKRAEAINDASRTAIRSCLHHAIAAAADGEQKWVDLLKDLPPLEDEVPTIILRLIGGGDEDTAVEEIGRDPGCATGMTEEHDTGASER